jgi:hypothetical protein
LFRVIIFVDIDLLGVISVQLNLQNAERLLLDGDLGVASRRG